MWVFGRTPFGGLEEWTMSEQVDRVLCRQDHFVGGLGLGIALGLLSGTALGNPPVSLVVGVQTGGVGRNDSGHSVGGEK